MAVVTCIHQLYLFIYSLNCEFINYSTNSDCQTLYPGEERLPYGVAP